VNKKRIVIIAVTLFLAQTVILTGIAPAEQYLLNPPTRFDISQENNPFRYSSEIYGSLLSFYLDDVFGRLPKTAISKICGAMPAYPNVKFDSTNKNIIGINKQERWIRYYLLSICGTKLGARVFRTGDYVPPLSVISELIDEKHGITAQILPANDILKDCKIKPAKIEPSSPVDKSA
jgi:hypothetical protein